MELLPGTLASHTHGCIECNPELARAFHMATFNIRMTLGDVRLASLGPPVVDGAVVIRAIAVTPGAAGYAIAARGHECPCSYADLCARLVVGKTELQGVIRAQEADPVKPCDPTHYPLDDDTIRDILLCTVYETVNMDAITRLTMEQRLELVDWTTACILDASDHEDIVIPPAPPFAPFLGKCHA